MITWYTDGGLSWLAYVHMAGDLLTFAFCVGLAASIHWARRTMEVELPTADQWILYGLKAFFVLAGVAAGLDFGLLLWPNRVWWIAIEISLKLGASLAAGFTFFLVLRELPRIRSAHAGIYMRRLAAALEKVRPSKPGG